MDGIVCAATAFFIYFIFPFPIHEASWVRLKGKYQEGHGWFY